MKTKTEKSFTRKLIECWVVIIIIVWLMISLFHGLFDIRTESCDESRKILYNKERGVSHARNNIQPNGSA